MIPLLTLPEVAAECGVTVDTVRNWHRAGRITLVRLPGGSLRMTREELDRITSSQVKPES